MCILKNLTKMFLLMSLMSATICLADDLNDLIDGRFDQSQHRHRFTKIRGCTSYIFASQSEHRFSAIESYRERAYDECMERGYATWRTITSKWLPGLNNPYRCLRGTIECLD